jgi:NADPH:quinone reductase-like Zn-dependent oxidoreductase
MTRENCAFAEGDGDHTVEKKLKESVFVGQVSRTLAECPVPEGALVTSLRRCQVQTKLVTVPVDALIPIPEKMDSAEAAAVVSTFTPAMGMLFHGRIDRESRFVNSSLKGLDILVTGGGTDDADAIVNLALLSGANRVFVLQSKLSLATWHAQSVHVELVSDNPEEWTPIIDRYMDLIMDLEYPKNFEALYGILKNTGRLVCRKPSPAFSGFLAPIEEFRFELALWSYPNASIYDLDEQIEDEHAEMVVSLETN